MKQTAIVIVTGSSLPLAQSVSRELEGAEIFSTTVAEGCTHIDSCRQLMRQRFHEFGHIVFIGALGICVRSIASNVRDKYTDPAVVCIDSAGRYVIPVLSGHIGGANDLARRLAPAIGATAVITTQSDAMELWSLDTMGHRFGWTTTLGRKEMNHVISLFVGCHPTALLLDIRDRGTDWLERNMPQHVTVFYNYDEIDFRQFGLLIAVTPRLLESPLPSLFYRPKVLHMGVGCRRMCQSTGIPEHIDSDIREHGLDPASLCSISTIELKRDEPLLSSLKQRWPDADLQVWAAGELNDIQVPNPSDKAFQVTGLYGVAESTAIKSSGFGPLIIEKQKGCLSDGNDFTYAVAIDNSVVRGGRIEIVGAGPGDPDLISVRGRQMLQEADLILYAGSLVPRELTFCAKAGAVVRSSADMDLEQQFALMKEFYDRGLFVVRLHTGDPCIYGAIQEQMAFFDKYGMRYHITPGISSFQAAAAALRSQFTIPEKVQSIILTRGEGRTPMPEKEQLHKLAQSNSTMCIFLSAAIVDNVQEELLQAYPPETPVAACYKLTWKDERIYRGELRNLARIVRENNLTLTTLLVVGEAIDNRKGLSRLYAHEFKHLFRK